MASSRLTLKSIVKDLLAEGILAPADGERLIGQHREDQTTHPLILIADAEISDGRPPNKPLTLEMLCIWLANKFRIPFRRIDPLKVDVAAITAVMSFAFAERNRILAIDTGDSEVTIATADPLNDSWESGLKQIIPRKKINRVLVNPVDLNRFIGEFYNLSHSVRQASGSKSTKDVDINNLEQLLELGRSDKPEANDQYIVNIVDWLLQYAFDQRASDIHLEPRREQGNIRFRIDGVLQHVYDMPGPVMTAVLARLKSLGRMDLAEKRRPLDGRLKTKTPEGKEVELRLSTLPTAFGEKMVMRIFDPAILFKSFEELGLGGKDYERWQSITSHTTGIVLVTGPTGSGKTTTLYSTLKGLATPAVNVCTIEDPIEMIEPSFNQMQVQQHIDLDFASGVKALLRQDPDIIMIGEIRDYETAQNAIQAALTGHLVISTLHTNDASAAVTRLIELGIAPYLISATLLGVMAQRLIRTLCPSCKIKGNSDIEAWKALVEPYTAKAPEFMYHPRGCHECRNTGYRGRIGTYEIIEITNAIRARIRPDCEASHIRNAAIQEGTHLLRLCGAKKVAQGLTTIEEVLRVTPHIDDQG